MACKMAAEIDNGSVAAPQQALVQGFRRRDLLHAPAEKRGRVGDHPDNRGRCDGRRIQPRLRALGDGQPALVVRRIGGSGG